MRAKSDQMRPRSGQRLNLVGLDANLSKLHMRLFTGTAGVFETLS